jgi:hypothetical protein
VAADVGVFVHPQHQRHRIPAHVMADALLDVVIARQIDLFLDRDRIDIRGVG